MLLAKDASCSFPRLYFSDYLSSARGRCGRSSATHFALYFLSQEGEQNSIDVCLTLIETISYIRLKYCDLRKRWGVGEETRNWATLTLSHSCVTSLQGIKKVSLHMPLDPVLVPGKVPSLQGAEGLPCEISSEPASQQA